MKKTLLLLLIAFIMTACGGSNESGDENPVVPAANADNYGKCKVKGVNFITPDPRNNIDATSSTYYSDDKFAVLRFFMGEAGASNGKRASVQFRFFFSGKGTYVFETSNTDAEVNRILYSYYGIDTLLQDAVTSGNGTVEITEYSPGKSVSGKFNFVLKDAKGLDIKLEEGEFKMPITF
jgi:hypothetical protein